MLAPVLTNQFKKELKLMKRRRYEIDSSARTVTFHRTGTHSDLFKK